MKKYLTNNLEAAITKKRIKGCIIPIDLGTSVIPYIAIIENANDITIQNLVGEIEI